MIQLNPQQREAVLHSEGPLLVLAGAGSGKTRVLTERIAHLIRDCGVDPGAILAVTFTNKAAREMRERVERTLGSGARGMWLATFHAVCARLLRAEMQRLGRGRDFTIYDDADQLSLIRKIASELNLSEELYPAPRLRAGIDRAKNEGLGPSELPKTPWDPISSRTAEVYARYQKKLEEYNAVDFGDLLLLPLQLLQTDTELRERYQQRFRYLLVDEYQDTNRAQYSLLRLLASGHGNLCVVGDDDQSIYRWRGADIGNILNFERDFPGTRTIRLEQNYRSTQVILDAAGGLIARNRGRKGKTLWTENGRGEPVRLYTAADERDEARYVTRSIEKLRGGGRKLGDIAVFYRTNAQSRAVEDELVRAGLPYAIIGATKFYDRKEIRDLLAYLRAIANPLDQISLLRIINTPPRGIGRTTADALVTATASGNTPLFDLLSDPVSAGLSVTLGRRVSDFGALMRRLRTRADGGVTPLLQAVIDETGYLGRLEDGTPEGTSRADNVRELLTVTSEFDAGSGGGLPAFLEQVSLVADVDSLAESTDRLTLMTLHNSKGLEFPVVFIIGMEEGLFPHERSAADADEIEEERRLCYVGMTRARESLVLVNAQRRMLYGRWQDASPSRFLGEIDSALLRVEAAARRDEDDDEVHVDYSYSQVPRPQWSPARRPAPPLQTRTVNGLRIGTQVRHQQFGIGVVRALEGNGDGAKALVQFSRGGLKKLVLRLAGLEVVSP